MKFIHFLYIAAWYRSEFAYELTLSHEQLFLRSFSASRGLYVTLISDSDPGLLGSKLLPEVISAIVSRYVTITTPTN